MSRTPEPFLCYGESYPIAKGLAMDAAMPKRTLSDIFGSPRRTMARDENTEENPMDYDTALEDGQWGKLKDFLSDKIPEHHMKTVEDICRKGGDAPKPGEDRRRPSVGASDTAMQRVERHRAEVREKHRRGLITDAELPGAPAAYGNITPQAAKQTPVKYDPTNFPNSGRLKV